MPSKSPLFSFYVFFRITYEDYVTIKEMKEFQRKQIIRSVIYSVPFLIILAILAVFLARGAVRVVIKERESLKYARNLEEKAVALVLRKKELEEGIASLQTEDGIKNEIRSRFSVTQEGEYIAIIVDEKQSSTSTDAYVLSWYKRFWYAIIKGK